MNKRMTFPACLALAAMLPGAAAFGQQTAVPVTVVASVGHSEWCSPPGSVRLNLATGRYAVTPSPSWRTCRRPVWSSRVRTGILSANDLAAVREAYRQARSDGLDDPACRDGRRPPRIVLSNGGERTLRLIMRRMLIVPPRDEGCWSDAASRLHRLLDEQFRPPRRR